MHPRIEIDSGDITNVSEVEFDDLCQQLADEINLWLNSDSFRQIDRQLRTQLSTGDEIRIIIETNDRALNGSLGICGTFLNIIPKQKLL